MTYQEKISNIIIRLKDYKAEHPELTLQKISDSTGISLSTVTRIFAEDSESHSFRYESIKPIAEMMLENADDEKALAIYRYNESYIKDLENKLAAEKEKYEKKLEKERSQFRTSLDFLKHQVKLKDDRIDILMKALDDRNLQFIELNTRYHNILDKYINQKEG